MCKEKLCINCALRKSVDKDGYIHCPEFKSKREAVAAGMSIVLHCWGDCYQSKTGVGK